MSEYQTVGVVIVREIIDESESEPSTYERLLLAFELRIINLSVSFFAESALILLQTSQGL